MKIFTLLENQVTSLHGNDKNIANYIKLNCQPWLNEIDDVDDVIYRGITSQRHNEAFIKPVRTNRKSLHTQPIVHKALVDVLNNMGAVANRDNSAFVSKKQGATYAYGTPFVVFPIGEFHYTWLKDVRDMFTIVPDYPKETDIEAVKQDLRRHISRDSLMIDKGYEDIKKEEIMIACKAMVYISVNRYPYVSKELSNL